MSPAIDTEALFLKTATTEQQQTKTKTLRSSTRRITAEGEVYPLPMQEEHILFDGCAYVVTHTFVSPGGVRTTEGFLWAGRRVERAVVLDAEELAQRVIAEVGAGSR